VRRYTNFHSFTGIESRYDILRFTQKMLWVPNHTNQHELLVHILSLFVQFKDRGVG